MKTPTNFYNQPIPFTPFLKGDPPKETIMPFERMWRAVYAGKPLPAIEERCRTHRAFSQLEPEE